MSAQNNSNKNMELGSPGTLVTLADDDGEQVDENEGKTFFLML